MSSLDTLSVVSNGYLKLVAAMQDFKLRKDRMPDRLTMHPIEWGNLISNLLPGEPLPDYLRDRDHPYFANMKVFLTPGVPIGEMRVDSIDAKRP